MSAVGAFADDYVYTATQRLKVTGDNIVANGDFAYFTITIGDWVHDLYWLEIMMLWFAVVGNITAIQRAIVTWKNMSKMEE